MKYDSDEDNEEKKSEQGPVARGSIVMENLNSNLIMNKDIKQGDLASHKETDSEDEATDQEDGNKKTKISSDDLK